MRIHSSERMSQVRRTRMRPGFTLWEMAMVMAILAILTSLAAPAFARFGADRPRTSTDLLMDVINNSRNVAVRNNVMATLTLDPQTGHFRLDTVGVNGLGVVAEDTLQLAVSERLETDLPRLRYMFRPTGATFGDTVIVHGTDAVRVVSVDQWSGVANARIR